MTNDWEEEWLRKTGRDYPPAVKEVMGKMGLSWEEYKRIVRTVTTPTPTPASTPTPHAVEYVNVVILKLNGGYKGTIVEWDGNKLDEEDWKGVVFRGLKGFIPGDRVNAEIIIQNGKMSLESVALSKQPSREQVTQPKENVKMAEKTVSSSITDGFFISDEARSVFNTALRMSRNKPERPVKVMMVGPSGYGKTALPYLFAQVAGFDFFRMNCANIRDPEEWFGFREAKGGETVFIPSLFMEKLKKGKIVMVLDEFNRVEPWLHNTLYPLLDDDGKTIVHDQEFVVGPEVIFVATINIGYKFTGTFELDEALYNRFPTVLEVGPLPHAEEVSVLVKRTGIDVKNAQLIVKVANILRQSEVSCSTRTTLLISEKVIAGMNLREAFEFAVVKRTPADGKRKEVIDLLNSPLGSYSPKKFTDDIFNVGGAAPLAVTSPEDDVKVPAFTFSKKEGASFSPLAFLQLLKKLPLAKPITSHEAADLAEFIERGLPVIVQMSREFTSDDPLVEEIRKVGMTARYHKTYQKVRGAAE